jgi:hypothetical protein
MEMSPAIKSLDVNSRYLLLRSKYEAAFRKLNAETQFLQTLNAQRPTDPRALEEAFRRVEQATAAYQSSRNMLTGYLLQRRRRGPHRVAHCATTVM